jgi:hypothetical protein
MARPFSQLDEDDGPQGRGYSSERFVIDCDGAKDKRVVLGGEIEKLEHRRADHPLIADEGLNYVVVSVARARYQFTGTVFFIEVFADLSHPLVVALDRPVGIFILQFHPEERACFKGKERALQTGMDKALDRPDFAALFFFAGNNLRFGAVEHGFHPRHRIVPAKTKWWQKLIGSEPSRS